MGKHAHLVMVTAANNNKYYDMTEVGDTIEVKYGRIGATESHASYPMSRWDSLYNSKIKKGYKDETSIVAVTQVIKNNEKYKPIENEDISNVVEYLREQARETVRKNYTVGSDQVTQEMVDQAQDKLNYILRSGSLLSVRAFNDELLELFHIIPRRMSQVQNYLAGGKDDFNKIIDREQKLLDVMAGQVVAKVTTINEGDSDQKDKTILEAMGLEFSPIDAKDEAIIKRELGECANLFYKAWRVENKETRKKFQGFLKGKGRFTKKLFWHGSRTENWWNILRTGLVLRPTNVVINGKMFGYGLYFAPKARKSVGYTSLRGSCWAGGYSNYGFLALCEVAYGKPYDVYDAQQGMTWDRLQKVAPGCTSLHAHAGRSLRNDEVIVYREDQVTIKYLVELRAR